MALYLGSLQISALSADTASKSWVQQQGYLTEVPSTYADKTYVDSSINTINSSVNNAVQAINSELDHKYTFTEAYRDFTNLTDSEDWADVSLFNLPLSLGTFGDGSEETDASAYGYTVIQSMDGLDALMYGEFPVSYNAVDNYVYALLGNKQDTLVSGTNIKTINNQSILGSGNISIDLTIYEVALMLPSYNINSNKIYLVPKDSGSTSTNQFDEYVYVNNTWEQIGTIEGGNVDLSDYLTIANASANFVTNADASTTYVKNASLDSAVSGLNYVKSSTLSDYLLSSTASSTYATKSSLDDYVLNASLDADVSALGYLKSNDVSNLATKSEISGFKNIVLCTDSEYAALVQGGTVDSNTVYLTYTASA